MQRKESRLRHNADFKAFVNAQREKSGIASAGAGVAAPLSLQSKAGSRGGDSDVNSDAYSLAEDEESSLSSAAQQHLRIKIPHKHVPQNEAQHRQQQQIAQPSSHANGIANNAARKVQRGPVSCMSPGAEAKQRQLYLQLGLNKQHGSAPSLYSASPKNAPSISPSPSVDSAVGFNVQEFRSQKDAERKEMRLIMQEKRRQLQKANLSASPFVEVEDENEGFHTHQEEGKAQAKIRVQDFEIRVGDKPSYCEGSGSKATVRRSPEKDTPSYENDNDAYAAFYGDSDLVHREGNEKQVADSKRDAKLGDDAYLGQSFIDQIHAKKQQASEQQKLLQQQGSAQPHSATTEVSMLEYSVLIEQMQAILRIPKSSKPPKHAYKTPAVHGEANGGVGGNMNNRVPIAMLEGRGGDGGIGSESANNKDVDSVSRRLISDLIVEEGDQEEQVDIEEEGVEDSDEFEEEDEDDERLLADAVEGFEEGNEGEDDDGFESDDPEGEGEEGLGGSGSELDDQLGELDGEGGSDHDEEEEEELLVDADTIDYSKEKANDPFRSTLVVPSMFTADLNLFEDPLRQIASQQQPYAGGGGAGAVGGMNTPAKRSSNGAGAVGSTPVTSVASASKLEKSTPKSPDRPNIFATAANNTEAQAKRLQIAELQEYLVSKLGSAKVSEALHLLSENTAATIVSPNSQEAERPDNYYDERDEMLLDKIEEILGIDSLHYLDDMFMLLSLQ